MKKLIGERSALRHPRRLDHSPAGRLRIGETSVLIIVARRIAGRPLTLAAGDSYAQADVPIWKQETFADGAVWAAGRAVPQGCRGCRGGFACS